MWNNNRHHHEPVAEMKNTYTMELSNAFRNKVDKIVALSYSSAEPWLIMM